MAELEYHHFTTLNVLIIPGNNDQWLLSSQRSIISYCVPSDDCPHHQPDIPGKKKSKLLLIKPLNLPIHKYRKQRNMLNRLSFWQFQCAEE